MGEGSGRIFNMVEDGSLRISARDRMDTGVFPSDHPIILFFLPLILTSSNLFKTTFAPL